MKVFDYIKPFKKPINIAGVLVSLMAVWCLTACSEDLNLAEGIQDDIIPEGYLQVAFNVSAPEKIVTRADQGGNEMKIIDLTIFIFNADGTQLIQKETVDLDRLQNKTTTSNSYSFTYRFPIEKSSVSKLAYAVANASSLVAEAVTVEGLEAITTTTNSLGQSTLFMSAKQSFSGNTVTLDLTRTTAKLTLKDESSTPEFDLEGFNVYYPSNACYVTAGASSTPTSPKIVSSYAKSAPGANRIVGSDGSIRYDLYSHPTITYSEGEGETIEVKTYVVVKGTYNGTTGYYAVALCKNSAEGGAESLTYLNILPNYWYDMRITKVNAPGYSSPQAAMANPVGKEMEVTIRDYSANVMAMVTDNAHELGASRQIYYDPDEKDAEGNYIYTDNQARLVVRFFCNGHGDEHFPILSGGELTGVNYSISSADDWIEIGEASDVSSDASQLSGGGASGDTESEGKRFEYVIKFDPSKMVAGESVIKISWMGLTLDVPVIYRQSFDASKILSLTKLTIHNTDANTSIEEDYWTFLSEKLKGADEEAMGAEKVRDDGFHFPIMYGLDSDLPWWYSYSFTLKDIGAVSGYKANIATDKPGVWENLTINGNTVGINSDLDNAPAIPASSATFSLSRPSTSNDYEYSSALLTLRIYTGTGSNDFKDLKFNLYHTGFFQPESEDWLYYEVVKLGEQYWLDRNVGATSNGLYIQTDADTGLFTETDGYPFSTGAARGDYLKIAAGESYGQPKFIVTVCPPGYRVPTKSEFDALRASSDFHNEERTDASSRYYTSYYDSRDAGKIYFPKSRFKNVGNWAGDNSAGYYWTQTIAGGYENLQIGHWVKAFYLSGNTSSFINADVDNYLMSLRCVAGKMNQQAITDESHTIGFSLKGATHVYLYSGSEGNRSGIFSFPGKVIGSDKDEKHLFTYNSAREISELKVYFTWRDDNGKIWVISRNPESPYNFDGEVHGNPSDVTASAMFQEASAIPGLTSIEGWPVWNGFFYDFSWPEDLFFKMYDGDELRVLAVDVKSQSLGSNLWFKYWTDSTEPSDYIRMNSNTATGNFEMSKYLDIFNNSISAFYFQFFSNGNGDKPSIIYKLTPPDFRYEDFNHVYVTTIFPLQYL